MSNNIKPKLRSKEFLESIGLVDTSERGIYGTDNVDVKCQDCGIIKNLLFKVLITLSKQNKRPYHCKKCICQKIDYNKRNEKTRATSLLRYGVETASQSELVKDKIKQTVRKKYGVDSVLQSKEVQEKIANTNIDKYGTKYVSQNNDIKEKTKKTNLERLGVEYPTQSKEVMAKVQATNAERYGDTCSLNNKEVKAKAKETLMNNYGVNNPIQNVNIMQKTQLTNKERYGDICSLNNSKIKAKAKETLMNNYGVNNPTQNRDVLLKAARSSNKSTVKYHWKTNEEVVCTANYECAVVNYLNLNKIDYLWQIPFNLPNSKVYICDLYLINEDKYIEIKGYFREDSKIKWQLFQEMQPNSELWDSKYLRSVLKLNIR